MENVLLDAMNRQTQTMLNNIDNPLVLLRYMHLAAAMPDRSVSNILLFASQSSDAWTLDAQGGGQPLWMSEWRNGKDGPERVPVPYGAGHPYTHRLASGAERLEGALRALGVKPAEDRETMERQFTRETLSQMRTQFREEYGYSVLPGELDLQAQGAAYIVAAHYSADISGAGFSGLFNEGAVRADNALETLSGMSMHARSFQRQLDRAERMLMNTLDRQGTRPRQKQKTTLSEAPQLRSFRVSPQR